MLAVPTTAALLAFFIFLPASATLTHVEAVLLPMDMQLIVPFDTPFAAPRLLSHMLFTAAWRSFNRPACLRVLNVDVPSIPGHVVDAAQRDGPLALTLHILAVPTSAALIAFFVLPASATLTCIEAVLAHCVSHPQYMYNYTMGQGCCARSRSHL
jgi:hypothetical protein